MLLLSTDETEALLEPDALREAMRAAMIDLSEGRASVPNRIAARVEEHEAILGAMPAYLPSARALAVKLVTMFPHNTGRPTHQAVVLVFDPTDGSPVAMMDGTSVTAERTAAVSALATDLLARPDARVLAVLGTGAQAASHLRAVARVRPFGTVRLAGRDPAKARALAAGAGMDIEVAATFAEAARGADVICATTHAAEPILGRADIAPGAHVCSVGFNPAGGELDPATYTGAAVFVETRDAALAPFPSGATDLRAAVEAGAAIRAELGEVAAGTAPGRTTEDEVTIYRGVGVAAEDAAAAAMVLARARAEGIGTPV